MKRCISTDRHRNRNVVSRESPDEEVNRRRTSLKKFIIIIIIIISVVQAHGDNTKAKLAC